jgi:hypothetical protein
VSDEDSLLLVLSLVPYLPAEKGEIIDAENYISEWFHGARVD